MNNEQRNIPFSNRKKGGDLGNITSKVNELDAQMAEKASKEELNALGQLKLDGTYTTLTDLETAHPTGAEGLFLVTTDGYTYRWDGSAWVQAVQFQSTGIANGSVSPDKTDFLKINRTNLFDKTKATLDAVVDSTTGQPKTNTSANLSDFILVTEGENYTTNANYASGYYDANKNYVQSWSLYPSGGTITIPVGVSYARASIEKTKFENAMFVKGDTLPTSYVPYEEYSIESKDNKFNDMLNKDISTYINENSSTIVKDGSIEPRKTDFMRIYHINLFDATAITTNAIVDQTTGEPKSYSMASLSDFMPIKEGEKYHTDAIYDGGFYDENKAYVQGLSGYNKNITVPTGLGIKYVRVGMGNTVISDNIPMFVRGTTMPSPRFTYQDSAHLGWSEKYHSDASNFGATNGLKWNVLGDSITAGVGALNNKAYHKYLTEQKGYMVRNYGIGGSTIAYLSTAETNPMCIRYANMDDDADIITVLGGINDIDAIPLGTMSDRTNDTFYGALHILHSGLIKKYLGKRIGIMTPLQKSNEGDSVVPFVNAVKEVANYYSLPVLDLYNESGLATNIVEVRDAYIPDGLHPNEKGHELIARRIGVWLDTL